MTEAEWLHATEPGPMLAYLGSKASNRKLRLLACGCCRRIWSLLTDRPSRTAVDVAEAYADQQTEYASLENAAAELSLIQDQCYGTFGYLVQEVLHGLPNEEGVESVLSALMDHDEWSTAAVLASYCGAVSPALAPEIALTASVLSKPRQQWDEQFTSESAAQCCLVRDIFGNPFRPVVVDPSWLNSTVVALARGLYEKRAFDLLPVLADALQEADCDNADILTHLRATSIHTLGCWALDLVLGKE
jgi:hypothetical protein